jgi:hypothetical protein
MMARTRVLAWLARHGVTLRQVAIVASYDDDGEPVCGPSCRELTIARGGWRVVIARAWLR